ncbi:hypothetical protein D3C75_1048250 [compost metagenome]
MGAGGEAAVRRAVQQALPGKRINSRFCPSGNGRFIAIRRLRHRRSRSRSNTRQHDGTVDHYRQLLAGDGFTRTEAAVVIAFGQLCCRGGVNGSCEPVRSPYIAEFTDWVGFRCGQA